MRRDMDDSVDARRVALAAALGHADAALVDDHRQPLADLGGELLGADRLLARHEALPAALLDLVGHGFEAEVVGARAGDRLVLERADAVELGFVEPVEQQAEVFLRLAGEADDEGRADRQVGADRAPGADALERLLLVARPLHRLQHRGRSVLERHVDIGQHGAAVHQRDDLVDVRVGVDVVQPHPDAERRQLARQVEEARRNLAVAPAAGGVAQVAAVGAGVLRDHQQFLDPRLHQLLGFAQHLDRRARDEVAAQLGDDAEGAAIVAAF